MKNTSQRSNKHNKGKGKIKENKNESNLNFVNQFTGVTPGSIEFGQRGIWTAGLSTCIYLILKTNNGYVGWHFSSMNCNDLNMDKVQSMLDSINNSDFVKGWIIRGADRNEDYELKPDCRTMQYRPDTDPTLSRNWFWMYLSQFPWSMRLNSDLCVNHYKDFIVMNDNLDRPEFIQNEKYFDYICIADAEQMV